METIKNLARNFATQVQDLLAYNKAATITVAAVSFVVGAFFF